MNIDYTVPKSNICDVKVFIRYKCLRECFLIHHQGHKDHEGLIHTGETSCEFVKFVAKNGQKDKPINSKTNFKTLSKGCFAKMTVTWVCEVSTRLDTPRSR